MATDKLIVLISADAKKFISELNKSSKQLDKFTDQGGKATKSTSGFGKSLGGLTSALGKAGVAAAAIGATAAIAKYGFEAAKIGAAQSRLETATDNLGRQFGLTADEIVNSIQFASGFTISQMDAMQSANAALMFGVAGSSEQFSQLTSIAVTLGRAMGQDASKSMEDLTLALGRQSPLILDNLGIMIDLEQEYRNFAIANETTVAALDEQTKKQIFINAALETGKQRVAELGGVQDDTASKLERLNAATDDFIARMGQAEVVTGATDLALNFATEAVLLFSDTLFGASDASEDMASASEEVTDALGDQAQAQEDAREAALEHERQQKKLTGAMADFFNQLDERTQQSLQNERDFVAERVGILNERAAKEREIEEERQAELTELEEKAQEDRNRRAREAVRTGREISSRTREREKRGLEERRQAINKSADDEINDLNARSNARLTKLEEDRVEADAIAKQEADDRLLLAALTNLELEGEFERHANWRGKNAKQVFDELRAGLIEFNNVQVGATRSAVEEIRALGDTRLANQQKLTNDMKIIIGEETEATRNLVAEYDLAIQRRKQFGDTSSIQVIDVNTFGRTPRRQFGGPLFAGQSALVGERRPEIFTPSVPGTVQPITNTTTNNMSLTINSQAQAEQVEQSFRMMQAMTQ